MARANRPPKPTRGISVGETRPYGKHAHNPAGSKMLRRFAKHKYGKRMSYKMAALGVYIMPGAVISHHLTQREQRAIAMRALAAQGVTVPQEGVA